MNSDNILADTATQNRSVRVRRILILMNIEIYLAFDQSRTNSESVLSLFTFRTMKLRIKTRSFRLLKEVSQTN
jgi:hypothetical protein